MSDHQDDVSVWGLGEDNRSPSRTQELSVLMSPQLDCVWGSSFECSSYVIFVAFAFLVTDSAMLFVTTPDVRQLHSTAR